MTQPAHAGFISTCIVGKFLRIGVLRRLRVARKSSQCAKANGVTAITRFSPMTSRAEALDADGPGYAGRYGAPMTITNGFADPELASLVRDHYTDPPFVGMPRWLIRRVLAACANSPFFTLLILRVQGEFAGLMLAQTVGDRPWRTVFRQSSLLLAVGAILVTGKRLRSLFRRRSDAITSQTPETSMLAECVKEAQSIRVKVEFIFIDPRFRGMRLAAALLRRLELEMVQRRVELGVAHIAAHNVASKAAFASAGWSVSPSAPGSLQAVKRFDPPAN